MKAFELCFNLYKTEKIRWLSKPTKRKIQHELWFQRFWSKVIFFQ